jgi:hypothetical protein
MVTVARLTSTLKMEMILSTETLVAAYKTIWRDEPKDQKRHFHGSENLKSQIDKLYFKGRA